MMTQRVSLLLIFSLASLAIDAFVEAKTRPVEPLRNVPRLKKDFDELDDWLNKNVDPGYGYEGGLDLALKKRADDLNSISPKASRALSMLDEMSKGKSNSCSYTYLDLIMKVFLDSGLEFYQGKRRVDIMADRFSRNVINCGKFVEDEFTLFIENLNTTEFKNLGKIHRHTFGLDFPSLNKVEVNTTPKQWAELLQDLAEQDNKNVYVGVKTTFFCRQKYCPLKKNFNEVYQEYLVRPCKYYNSKVAKIMEATYALGSNTRLDRPSPQANPNHTFLTSRSNEFLDGLTRYFVCKEVINNKIDRQELLNELYKRNKPRKQ